MDITDKETRERGEAISRNLEKKLRRLEAREEIFFGFKKGDRVRLKRNVERSRSFTASQGMTGTVVPEPKYIWETNEDSHKWEPVTPCEIGLWVKVDQPIAGCEEWDNHIHWSEWDAMEEGGIHADIEVINNTVITAQGIDTREFWIESKEDVTPELNAELTAVVNGFLTGVLDQTGITPEIWSGEGCAVVVDMSDWPEGEPYGEWFDEVMERHSVKVCD